MAVGDHGERLNLLIESRFSNVKDAAKVMRSVGCRISLDQLHRIRKGQQPTLDQIKILCRFFGVTPEWLMFGVDDGLLDKLLPEDRIAVESIIKRLIKRTPPDHQ